MPDKLALDLPVLLPDTHDAADRCVDRLTSTLTGAPGVEQVHVIAATAEEPARLCLHWDPATTSVSRIRELATSAGAAITEQFGHVLWQVTGVRHPRKARSVAETLRRLHGVVEAEVTPGLVRIEFDRHTIDEQQLTDTLARAGVSNGQGDHDHGGEVHVHGGPFGEQSELVFAITSAVLWVAGLVLDFAGAGDRVISSVFIVAGIFGGYFTLREAIDGIRNRRFEIDFLMLVAAAGAWALGKWEEGALLLALFSVGHALEGYAMGRARRAIEALAELAPATAIVRDDTGEHEIPVEELTVGALVVVKPNERIPADGFVIAGTSAVNQAPLTGESIPVDKHPVEDATAAAAAADRVAATSRLYAGTINGAGQLDLQVTRLATDTTLSKLAQLVREAETQASPTQRFTDRFEKIFVPAVLALVAAVLIFGTLTDSSFADAFYRAMAVLVAASPCALAIATPSAVLAAVARAGQLGVLVKGGAPLENLGSITAIAFDKTGTLTEGRPKLTDVIALADTTPAELLSVAISVESRSDHPLAGAIVRDGSARITGATIPTASAVTAVTGKGVRATVDGMQVSIGNTAMFDDELDSQARAAVELLQATGRTIMIVKHGERFLGVLGLMDTPRADARDAIEAIRRLGVTRSIMLSGDHQLVANSIARQVGLDEAWGDLMPEEKVAAIERLRNESGRVAMVGDGVNDAPALAHATVGIAMGAAGSDVALETADVALMADDLSKLPVVIGLSRRASRIIRQNLYISLGMVAVLVPATLVGFVGIGPAVILHEGSTLIVVANALRLLAYQPTTATPR